LRQGGVVCLNICLNHDKQDKEDSHLRIFLNQDLQDLGHFTDAGYKKAMKDVDFLFTCIFIT
jgi:hypothetical protein